MKKVLTPTPTLQKTFLSLLAAASLTIAAMGTAQAVPVTFFGENLSPGGAVTGDPVTARNSFFSNLVGVGTETFEGFTGGDTPPFNILFPGAGTATLTGISLIYDSPAVGRFPTSGSNYLETTSGFTLTFDQPIAAFGFFATDIGDFSGQITLALSNGENLLVPNTMNAPNASLLFYGVIDTTTFTSVTFGNTNGVPPFTDVFGFDDFTIGSLNQVGNPVPEPGTMLLLGSGLVGLMGYRMKKARAKA